MPPQSCMVLHCTGHRSDPHHQVMTTADGDGGPAPVCAEHWRLINEGERWLWVPGRWLKGVGSGMSEGCILMGDELVGYGLVVDADVRMSNSKVFSPDIAEGRETTTLAIDGLVFGANQRVSIELVLTPETVQQLREALRFVRP
ncbi:MAG TPA: hypothetical protein VIY28_08200 [Pseudonocardiaceae bacterium]